ncbi:MAG: hypothetical protein HUK20_00150, partial [Fibrobacter sp.]|nr:hypothetical protein [Fibrobacter sp.]
MTKKNFISRHVSAVLFLAFLLASCAGMRDLKEGTSAGGDSMQDSPCEECGNRGDIELKITREVFYREWNPAAYRRLDSNAVVGVF